ncbi:hypothetical protein [Streptomyces sp. NPDC050704]|uniref:hypothetical protein n=1 Tax=Streptomyces sp. NPDC050704 TaxID=3157219 RepID=UPI0034286CAB
MVALVDPLTAAAIGVPVFGERLNAIALTGTALLLFAVLFLAAHEELGSAGQWRWSSSPLPAGPCSTSASSNGGDTCSGYAK